MDLWVNGKEQMQGSSLGRLMSNGVFHGCLLPLGSSLSPGGAAGQRALEDMGTATPPSAQSHQPREDSPGDGLCQMLIGRN